MAKTVVIAYVGLVQGLRLHLYGGVAWSNGSVRHPVPAGRPGQILAVLAERRGTHTTADHLIDRLWPVDAPASGRNALQRHISRVRRHLAWEFSTEFDPILHSHGGYALAPEVETDLDLMRTIDQAIAVPTPTGPAGVRWADEPVPDLPWDGFESLRGQLRQHARRAALRWGSRPPEGPTPVEVARLLQAVARFDPLDAGLAEAAALAARRTGDPLQIDGVRRQLAGVVDEVGDRFAAPIVAVMGLLDEPGRTRASDLVVNDIAAAWVMGDRDAALGLLDDVADMDPHVRAAVRRVLERLDPIDGFVKELFTEMVGMWSDDPFVAQRCLVSLDARNYEAMSRTEWDELRRFAGDDPVALGRALRTEALALMAQPLDERTDQIIDELERLGDPDSIVEAARFRSVRATRNGRFVEGLQLLDAYEATVADQWPGYDDAFGGLSRLVYSLRPGLSELDLEAARVHRFPRLVSDRSTAELADVLARLIGEPAQTNPSVRAIVQSARLTVPLHGQVGLDLLWLVATDELDAAVALGEAWVGELPSMIRNRFTPLLELGLARLAIQTRSAPFARAVVASLEPFAGEELGLWPTDALLGSVDDLLQELEEIVGSPA